MATTSYSSVRPLYKASMIVWYVAGIIESLLAIRFILRLIGANTTAGFVQFMYDITRPLIKPFQNIVHNSTIEGSVFDWNVIIAMAVYWLLAWAIVKLFFIGRPVTEDEADYEIKRENDRV